MGWNGLERNRLDYILTDLLPVEVSELFSFSQLYSFLLEKSNQQVLNKLICQLKKKKAEGNSILFKDGWSTKPLKYRILKGNNTTREMSIIQPFSAINILLFIECYQREILYFFEKHHFFSIRYHRKNSSLLYKSKFGKRTNYFQTQVARMGTNVIQQAANYFKIVPFESINSFTDSQIWRTCNFEYNYYAKFDYKSCFDSIYTHVYTWLIEKNVIDAKDANNSHLFIEIDRVLQNINGRSSNGIVVGPEFSRMMAEILLQHIDSQVKLSLEKTGIEHRKDYVTFRYVDDIFVFAKQAQVIDQILSKYKTIGEHYLLRMNELKFIRGVTPCLPKEWLEKTRQLSDLIGEFFHHGKKKDANSIDQERYIIKNNFISINRIKDEIAVLTKQYSDDSRTIVSFLLSTLLNNISKKKDGYKLFSKKSLNKALLLIDLALYIYAFYPSFDQTRKVISIISYLNSEILFKNDDNAKENLSRIIKRYSFIFQSENIFDLCDWFPFFTEYKIELEPETEHILLSIAKENNDPIILANLLLYSRYYDSFFKETQKKVESIVKEQISKISEKQPMMQTEFWYVLIFHNCPYLSDDTHKRISELIGKMKTKSQENGKEKPSAIITQLVCDFLERQSTTGKKPKESLFNWNGIKNFSDQITYRTYQRTLFKSFNKNAYTLFASID